ncbi:hypothetical protein CTAYLR_009902 [Chrysophaeum taylorii]|uniref:Mitochondrial carrier protein n=1 Tax=Chrysophaeum taylorii TaxID=2483200 RepID=A0AAD7XRF6_9STRA|nr:hypothetical protein CTAYLR_009902 [Chrysophaeum taylorii]
MAHTQKRASWIREGQIAVVGGALYGLSHTVSGHPLDNIKAAMQLDARYRGLSTFAVASRMWREAGLGAFARGCIPPLWGSTVYRSAMMSSYEATYTALDAVDPKATTVGRILHAELLGMRPLVVVSSVACSVFRAIFESPIEYAKVMRQTGRPWQWGEIYRGAGTQVARTTAMLTFIFVPYDAIRRHTSWFDTLYGQWIVVTLVCGASYALAWPLETLKNLAQAGRPRAGASVGERLAFLGGVRGLYAGAGPGIVCGGFRNGIAMLTMAKYHALATHWGLRAETK